MIAIQLIGITDSNFTHVRSLLYQILDKEAISINWVVEEVTDIDRVLEYDITQIPALAIDGQIIWEYNLTVLTKVKLTQLLQNRLDPPSSKSF